VNTANIAALNNLADVLNYKKVIEVIEFSTFESILSCAVIVVWQMSIVTANRDSNEINHSL